MKLKILKTFRDKETGEIYKPNAEVEFTDERAAVILADKRKVAEAIKPKKTTSKTTTARKKK